MVEVWPKISIVIAIEKMTAFLRECLIECGKLDYPDFEILVFISEDPKENFDKTRFIVNPALAKNPAKKRDEAIKYAKGEILAFIDDDAYPSRGWLKNAVVFFESEKVAGVGGPGITPSNDGILERVGGWVWSTWIGSGGAGTYRCVPKPKREVDDYPTFNLLVRKSDFVEVGGFDSSFWPGEDTKMCHDLVYKLGKKIIYDPDVLVYHHRRPIFEKHLQQLGRYGLHRGYFARTLPKTSRRLGYFIPSLFTLFFLSGLPLSIMYRYMETQVVEGLLRVYLGGMGVYIGLLLINGLYVFWKERNPLVALFFIPAVFATHLEYGIQFIRGFFSKKLEK